MNRSRHMTRRGFTSVGFATIAALASGTIGASSQSLCGADKPSAPGLISATAYESPTYGIDVSWSKRWEVGDAQNPAVVAALGARIQPVDCGIGNGGSDSIVLEHRREPRTVIRIQIYEQGMWTFTTMADAMQQPGWVQNLLLPAGSDMLWADDRSDSLMMVARDADDPDHIVYHEATFPPDTTFIISATVHLSDPETYMRMLDDAESIDIEDFTLFSVATPEAILDAIDN